MQLINNSLNSDTIQVHTEDVDISKKVIETGKITIEKTVDTTEISKELSLTRESVKIKKVEINEEVDVMPFVRKVGNVTIIPVVKEIAVVVKKLILLEEIHLIKSSNESIELVETSVRKENIKINKEY